VKDQVSHSYKTKGKITVLYALYFWTTNRKTKDSGLNGNRNSKKHRIYLEGYRIYGNFTTHTTKTLFRSVYHSSSQFQFYRREVTVYIIPSQKLTFQSLVVYFYVLTGLALARQAMYTGCPKRNVPDFGRVFLMLKYTDITQNSYIQI
jgi:hypothetical protein